jgi:NarL family two-component system response regulator LiaR
MGKSPVRVAVMSGSRIVRDGLVSLVGELGDRATVVDADSVEDDDGDVDVVIYDLGAAQGLSGYAELRRLLGLEIPLVALVYDGLASSGQRPNDGPQIAGLISLEVTVGELWNVLERATPGRGGDHQDDPRLPAGLTKRELTVLTLIGAGLSNEQIADRLVLSGNTVKTHIRTAYRKIRVRSRIHAALWAMEHGLVAWPVRERLLDDVLDAFPATGDQPTAGGQS